MMLFGELDSMTIATYIVGFLTILVLAITSAGAAFAGSVRTSGKIETKMAEQHGENKASIAGIVAGVDAIKCRVEDIADGKTAHVGEIVARLDGHDDQITALWEKKADRFREPPKHEGQ
jgi:hypothetical protein